jgi:hypothetical protein
MAYITALLVVLTLTGEPVANALCVTWCDSSSEKQTCDQAIAQTADSAPTITGTACTVSVTIAPFLSEEARGVSRMAVAADRPGALVAVPDRTNSPRLRIAREATDRRPAPVFALRV